MFVTAVSQERGVPALRIFVKYARVELPPPRWSELPQVRKGFRDLLTAVKTQKWREATVKVNIFVRQMKFQNVIYEAESLFLSSLCMVRCWRGCVG